MYYTNTLTGSWIFIEITFHTGGHFDSLGHNANSNSISLCSYFLMLHAWLKSIKYQFYCLWFYIQWNLSNPIHQGSREMCRIAQVPLYNKLCPSVVTNIYSLINTNNTNLKKEHPGNTHVLVSIIMINVFLAVFEKSAFYHILMGSYVQLVKRWWPS